jgi:hypothetical protein
MRSAGMAWISRASAAIGSFHTSTRSGSRWKAPLVVRLSQLPIAATVVIPCLTAARPYSTSLQNVYTNGQHTTTSGRKSATWRPICLSAGNTRWARRAARQKRSPRTSRRPARLLAAQRIGAGQVLARRCASWGELCWGRK